MTDQLRATNLITGDVHGQALQIGTLNGHVFLERPAYRLQRLVPSATVSHVPRSRQGPSYLLDARRQIVPFRPRPAEMARLCDWANDPAEPVSVLLVHGPGGHGKTRLAGQFAASAPAGWLVAEAAENVAMLPPAPVIPGPDDSAALLLIIDYADRWRLDTLVQLIASLPVDYPHRRVRVVLLARPGSGLWKTLRSKLGRSPVDLAEPLPLGEFTADRRAAFADAVAAFSAQLGLSPRAVNPPADLADEAYRAPLDLHMAALATVCARRDGVTAPRHEDLSAYLLEHERRCWLDDGAVEPIVLLATLFGPLTYPAARDLVRQARLADGDAEAGRMIDLHEFRYPAPDGAPRSEEVLRPLRPDRLGEDFVAECLERENARSALFELLAAGCLDTVLVRRCLTVLGAAADRLDHVRDVLFEALRVVPALAEQATAPIVRCVTRYGDSDLAFAVYGVLPRFTTELLDPAADLAQRLVDELSPTASDYVRVTRLSNLGIRLFDAGRRLEAVEPGERAVEICRRLAEEDPDACTPTLAMTLSNLGLWLIGVGRRDEAMGPIHEAVEIYRELAAVSEFEHLPALAMSLNNLGLSLSEVGRREDAVGPATEAVDMYRYLVTVDATEYRPTLALSLTNLGKLLSEVGRRVDAVEPATEAVEIYRRLVEADPSAYRPALALSLTNLGKLLSEVGRRVEAVDAVTEAVEMYRRLVDANPLAYLPSFALSLNNLGNLLLGDMRTAVTEAVEPAAEAVEIYRRLVAVNPAAYSPDLARALSNLGLVLAGDDAVAPVEAVEPATEAVEIYTRLAAVNPAAYSPDLARALNTLGVLVMGDRAVALASEAVAIYRWLARENPAAYTPYLATSLAALAWVRVDSGNDLVAALAAADESIALLLRLSADLPSAFDLPLREARAIRSEILGALGADE